MDHMKRMLCRSSRFSSEPRPAGCPAGRSVLAGLKLGRIDLP